MNSKQTIDLLLDAVRIAYEEDSKNETLEPVFTQHLYDQTQHLIKHIEEMPDLEETVMIYEDCSKITKNSGLIRKSDILDYLKGKQ